MKEKLEKYSRLIRAILITIAAIFIIGLLTHFISSWSADVSSEQEIRIQNLLTMQKDSLEGIYIQEKIDALDSVEVHKKQEIAEKDKQIISMKEDLKTEKNKNEDLREKFKNNPTLENCIELSGQQDKIIDKQYTVIDSLDAEAQEWCELYENENAKGILKDTLIAKKTRTIATLNNEVKTVNSELKTINDKIDSAKWFKRNWLWVTNSYRNWLRNTK